MVDSCVSSLRKKLLFLTHFRAGTVDFWIYVGLMLLKGDFEICHPVPAIGVGVVFGVRG